MCAIAYVDPRSGVERLFEGRCAGRLANETRGERGFGYDPAFLPDDGRPEVTMAELQRRAEGRHQPPRPRRAPALLAAAGWSAARPSEEID